MNILSKLPFLKDRDGDDVIDVAEERKARIQFHRDKVRNGPVKFNGPTNGQIRRQQKRIIARQTKNNFTRQKRLFWAAQQEAATLRGQLQFALVIPSVHFTPTPQQSLSAITWIVERFAEGDDGGQVVVTEDLVRQSLQSALNRYETVNGKPITLLPDTYVLPVALSA